MLTKYILTIGSTEYEIPDECLKNWDEISFSLKRTDYSGVMRSFSTEFIFVGEIYDLLFAEYLDKGFLASASVAVYTITNRHEWELQYSAALDFSTIEIESGSLSINAMDNALASLLKSKKSQKYEYPVSDFSATRVNVSRIEIANYGLFSFVGSSLNGLVELNLNENASLIISKEYIELSNQASSNSFFAHCKTHGAALTLRAQGTVRCFFCPYTKDGSAYGSDIAVSQLSVYADYQLNDENFRLITSFNFDDAVQYKRIHGQRTNILVNSIKENVFRDVTELNDAALARFGGYGSISNDYSGIFGVVGSYSDYNSASYWQNNTIYEFQNGHWINKGTPENYYQDRQVDEYATVPADNIWQDTHVRLRCEGQMTFQYATLIANWADPIRNTLSCRCISPLQLITKIVRSITGEETAVSIAADDAGLIAKTYLLPGEELRQISTAKVYSTFGNFADWMEAVFGYTYRVVGDELQFVHRSAVFVDEVAKTIDNFRDVKLSIVDDLIYTTIEAGYSKKEYGEIDGRLEKNFTNYYSTGFSLTDKKLTLQSKYRADSYGLEFTARKSESETKDDKADEDVFFIRIAENASTGVNTYQPSNNDDYNPSVCVENNKAFIAVFGNGKAVTLTMTSSDGNNALGSVEIAAGTALFTAAELEFTTDDMEMPSDINALVQLDYKGFRIKGFIKEAECRFGKRNGVEYTLIVKEITEI